MLIDKNAKLVVYTMKKCSNKKNELLLYAMTWMNFIDIISGKKHHSPKNTNFRVPFI